MKINLGLLFLIFFVTLIDLGCKKKAYPVKQQVENNLVSNIIKSGKSFIGTPYKFGGIDKNGMDCSGLIYSNFKNYGITVPRNSFEQSKVFKEISKKDLQIGDLIYFNTSGTKINHTGIVCDIDNKNVVYFLHSSTSKGVRIDNLENTYWKPKFVKATRPNYSEYSRK